MDAEFNLMFRPSQQTGFSEPPELMGTIYSIHETEEFFSDHVNPVSADPQPMETYERQPIGGAEWLEGFLFNEDETETGQIFSAYQETLEKNQANRQNPLNPDVCQCQLPTTAARYHDCSRNGNLQSTCESNKFSLPASSSHRTAFSGEAGPSDFWSRLLLFASSSKQTAFSGEGGLSDSWTRFSLPASSSQQIAFSGQNGLSEFWVDAEIRSSATTLQAGLQVSGGKVDLRLRWLALRWFLCACRYFSNVGSLVAASFTFGPHRVEMVPRSRLIELDDGNHGFSGIVQRKGKGTWVCEARISKKKWTGKGGKAWLGSYRTPEQAARASDVAKFFLCSKSVKRYNFSDSEKMLSSYMSLFNLPQDKLLKEVKKLAKQFAI